MQTKLVIAWQPGTALFDRNYEAVLNFVTEDDVHMEPLPDLPLVSGQYHA